MDSFNPNYGQKIKTNADLVVNRGFSAHYQIPASDAVAQSDNGVHDAISCSSSDTVEITDNITNPAVPRNITAKVTATTDGDIAAVQVTIEGTNFAGETITETLPTFTADTEGEVAGSKAFKTVTKISIPAMDGSSVSVVIGWGDMLGLPHEFVHDTVLKAYHNNTEDGSISVNTNASNIESNTIEFNSALDGTVLDVYFMV